MDVENYYFNITDPNIERVTIILNAIAGETYLFASRTEKFPPTEDDKSNRKLNLIFLYFNRKNQC